MHSLDELVLVLDRLIARMDELEARVRALEQFPDNAHSEDPAVLRTQLPVSGSSTKPVAAAAAAPVPALTPVLAPEHPIDQLLSQSGPGTASVIGKVFLGVAGAYVLRALAESGALPQLAIICVALAYAGVWLVWAARVTTEARFASAAYAGTSAFILSPMLWELTLRFKVLSHAVTALLLVTFVVAAAVLSWKRNLTAINAVTTFSASITALGLLIATRDPAPFALALIITALLMELAICFGRCLNLRLIVATALDLALGAVVVIYTAEQGIPPEYTTIRPALVLGMAGAPFVIYGVGAAFWSVILLRRISVLQIIQTVIAFLIAWFGILRETHHSWAPAVGVFCVVLAAVCYVVALSRFNEPQQSREYHVFSTWAAALFFAGNWLLFTPGIMALVLSLSAVCAAWTGVRSGRLTLEYHSTLYLSAGTISSGLLAYGSNVMFGMFPSKPSLIAATTATLAVLCYTVAGRLQSTEWRHQLARLLLAIQAAFAVTTFAALGLVWLIWAGTPPNAARLAVIRTLVICAVAPVLGLMGARRNKVELVWAAYGAMGLCTLKLLFEDLRTGSTGSMAVSLFLYGMVWLLLPRLVRSRAHQPA